MRLKDKVAIVTGAAQGFGAGIAQVFAREGAKVICCDLNGEGAEKMAESLMNGSVGMACDVSRLADARAVAARALAAFGRLDIVVNNAGTSHRNKPLLEVTEEEFDRVVAVNVKSLYNFAIAAVPAMQAQQGGAIVNIGSTAGIRPRPGLTWYNGTKGAVHLMSKSMAVELAPWRIRVNVIAPVAGETPLLTTFMGEDSPEIRSKFLATIPLGRFSTPRDIAHAALFLASDEASMITGAVLEVDGGRCI
ncbi:MAG: glucose 1-dehydrogenase [Hyphomicrobiales bacterium]|uniref:glucose 1-dehydrogenase n=1 Tax=Rhabdaerophilum calidifontis TaxID=2604328 RepID=UPI00123AD212|nr:glucose 1-dehydrogenase [Rhabdaerophilum calidifontis]MCA1951547.1 glucose 1-dehydrogenase [Hyphomicrobiales bacterium]MCA1999022.1 glucose 1-dehydrogenase [Hyphomicrobiales bacterium]